MIFRLRPHIIQYAFFEGLFQPLQHLRKYGHQVLVRLDAGKFIGLVFLLLHRLFLFRLLRLVRGRLGILRFLILGLRHE